ncbi:hypothetical protein DSL64_12495 [Dyadobacter luteus]|jgi:hypothetical protein|uniref:Uncharacterized protein n=1 Tax=Dyadobacter luteus TaxID=2259619 RepID=A0A3D8YB58_9BACT|nr:hypothetical protein [Dyadobacter luteus]REA61264.1 hypothetical protein DSL64_12495 [Dyadobacter luteus]
MDNKRIRLDDLKKETPFSVPDGYFDELPQIIQAKITSEPVRKPLVGWSWQRSVALVSAMSLVFLLVWITVPEKQGALGQAPLADISDASIISYLEEEDMSYYDLSEHKVVQHAFDNDTTILHYLDGMDSEFIRQQIIESTVGETI